jgi:hypothetical protein
MPTARPLRPLLSDRALRRALTGVASSWSSHILVHARLRGLAEYRAWFGAAPATALRDLLVHRLRVLETPTARVFVLGRQEFALLVAADSAELDDWCEDVRLALGPAGSGFHLSVGCAAVALGAGGFRPGAALADARRASASAPGFDRGFTAPSRDLISSSYSPDATAQDLSRALALRLGAPAGWLPLAAAAHEAGAAAMPTELLERRDGADPAEHALLSLQSAAGRHLMRADARLAPGARLLGASTAPWRQSPLEGRVLSTVLAYASMTEAHGARPAMSTWDALTVLRREAGEAHDPRVVDALIAELASRAAAGFRAPERRPDPAVTLRPLALAA